MIPACASGENHGGVSVRSDNPGGSELPAASAQGLDPNNCAKTCPMLKVPRSTGGANGTSGAATPAGGMGVVKKRVGGWTGAPEARRFKSYAPPVVWVPSVTPLGGGAQP